MKFSYNWLKEYIDIKETPEELAEILTMHSFEAEGVEKGEKRFANVIVGEVLGVKKHPRADKLSLVAINTGKGVLEIVCGAPNVARGQKAVVALPGASLPGGMAIMEREVRGVKSQGMICAKDELGLSADHEGIMVLPPETPAGITFSEFLGLDDSIIDFAILPDRAHDALSYWGMAREISAVLGRKLKKGIYDEAKFNFKENAKIIAKKEIAVEIRDKNLCRRYSARTIKNVSVSESPAWLKKKVESAGIRSINNLVDISNLVMIETGQPLHIFDLGKIEGAAPKKIIIRRAKKGENLLALDGKEYKLDENILVIADAKKPLAIAGIIGAEFSGVKPSTKNIIIESANFDPVNIRQSSKALGLVSDSSYRFEREIDQNLTVLALNRAAELVGQISGGQIAKGVIDIYPLKTKPKKIKFAISEGEKILGDRISLQRITKILANLGFSFRKVKKNLLEITIPTRRLDVTGPIEIVREIARIYGYDNIKPVKPKIDLDLPRVNFNVIYQNKIKKTLAVRGFTEVYNYSFVGGKELENIGTTGEHYLELANPLNPEHKYLRLSLIPSLLDNISRNAKLLTEDEIRIFEIGKVYYHKFMGNNTCFMEKNIANDKSGVSEKFMLAAAFYKKASKNLFYETKNAADLMLNLLNIKNASYIADTEQCPHLPVWHLGRYALVASGEEIIGVVGEINPRILGRFKISGRVGAFNFDFQKIVKIARAKKMIYGSIPKFPAVKLDLAILVPKKVLWSQIKESVCADGKGLVKNVELFDVYTGKNILSGKKSLAFHIVFQSMARTLEDEEIRQATGQIIEKLKNKFRAELRKNL